MATTGIVEMVCNLPYHPFSISTLLTRHRKVTVTDPSDSFVVMLKCGLNRLQSTEPLLDTEEVS